jgi:hypothetical protein
VAVLLLGASFLIAHDGAPRAGDTGGSVPDCDLPQVLETFRGYRARPARGRFTLTVDEVLALRAQAYSCHRSLLQEYMQPSPSGGPTPAGAGPREKLLELDDALYLGLVLGPGASGAEVSAIRTLDTLLRAGAGRDEVAAAADQVYERAQDYDDQLRAWSKRTLDANERFALRKELVLLYRKGGSPDAIARIKERLVREGGERPERLEPVVVIRERARSHTSSVLENADAVSPGPAEDRASPAAREPNGTDSPGRVPSARPSPTRRAGTGQHLLELPCLEADTRNG